MTPLDPNHPNQGPPAPLEGALVAVPPGPFGALAAYTEAPAGPPALSAAPTLPGLMQALRRRWLLAVSLATVATVAAVVAVFLWLPPRYAIAYWVYRMDLLALPLLVAIAVVLLFGLPALLRSASAFGLFLLGWQPVFDRIVGLVAHPLAQADAFAVGLLAGPFTAHATRTGQFFAIGPNGSRSVAILAWTYWRSSGGRTTSLRLTPSSLAWRLNTRHAPSAAAE